MISGREVIGLSFFFVFVRSLIVELLISVILVFFDRWVIALRTFGINFPTIGGELEVSFCLCISSLLHSTYLGLVLNDLTGLEWTNVTPLRNSV